MGSHPPVTACLISWKRPENLRSIIAYLKTIPFITEILVWNNNPTRQLDLAESETRVIEAGENYVCYARFLCARQAKNSIIYVQDDDALVRNIPELYAAFLRDPTRIAHNLSEYHFHHRWRHIYGNCHSALIGWGAFFHQDWLEVLEKVPPDFRETPLFRREADQFFTILLKRHHNSLCGQLQHLETHSEPGIALWQEPDFFKTSALAVRYALSLARRSLSFRLPPRWHVVITCCNYGSFLLEAVESVVRQDADYELTIVDDASLDETPAIAAGIVRQYPHIRYLRLPQNRGVAQARNVGIASQDSLFVVNLDADDHLGSDYLFEAGRVLDAGADIANPDAILFGEDTDRWQVPDRVTLPGLLRHNSIHYCAAFRRSYWMQVEGFDELIADWEDYDFWIRLVAAGARVRAVKGDHFFYRRHRGQRSDEAACREKELAAALQDKHADLYGGFHGHQQWSEVF